MHDTPFLRFAFLPLLVAVLLPAQQRDPMQEIQEIARSIDEQMQEIDRLLLESGKKNQARTLPKELLLKARESSKTVEGGIDQLIEKLNQMKQQGGGGGGGSSQSQDQQQQPQDQQSESQRPDQGKGQRTRRENQNPDYVKQPPQGGEQPGQKPQPQPGQQPGQQPQPGQGKPQGGQESPGPGENTRGNRQLEPELGPGNPGQGNETWGELQSYTNFLKNKGSMPKVPEKYRKYWEAYLKNKQSGATGSGGK